MKVWRAVDGDTEPVAVECKAFGWPNLDSNGLMMFDNTHFRTEAEAWKSVLVSVDADVSLSGRKVLDLRNALAKAEHIAGGAAANYALAYGKFREWERRHSSIRRIDEEIAKSEVEHV